MQRRAVLLSPPNLPAARVTPGAGLPVRGGGYESEGPRHEHGVPPFSSSSANERRKQYD